MAPEPTGTTDPLLRVGQQLIDAAIQQSRRRRARRRRGAILASIAVCLLGAGLGAAAIHTDILGPDQAHEPDLLQHHDRDRVDVVASAGLARAWTFTVYRNDVGGLCVATAPSTERASQIACGAASLTAAQLSQNPLNSLSVRAVERTTTGEQVVISGLADRAASKLDVRFPDGSKVQVQLGNAVFTVPITQPGGATTGELVVRPFIASIRAPVGVPTVALSADIDSTESAARVFPVKDITR